MPIQIIEENRRPSTSERFNQSFGKGMQALGDYAEKSSQKQSIKDLMGDQGEAISNLPPDLQKLYVEKYLSQQNKSAELQGEHDFDEKSFETVKNAFGEKFANVWKTAPQGGKTALIQHGLDALSRGENIDELLNNVSPSQNLAQQGSKEIPENVPQMKGGKIDHSFEWPNFSQREQGYTPKEWNDVKKEWVKGNTPVFKENSKHLKNIKGDQLATKKLRQLNPKMPEGMSSLLINPDTGDFYGVAQVLGFKSPEAQQWSKVIARFQNRAKDAFGSRVTNFDLQSYMKQFPDLLNTKEGRERILDMMEINYELDSFYDTALQKIYDKYGLGGIPPEKADELARKMIKEDSDRLENKYLDLDLANNVEESKPKITGKMIDVVGPDGQTYEIDEGELDQLPEGYLIK